MYISYDTFVRVCMFVCTSVYMYVSVHVNMYMFLLIRQKQNVLV